MTARPRTWQGVLWALAGLLGVVALLYTAGGVRRSSAPLPGKGDQTAADFTLPDVDGKRVALSSLRGKVVLLDFWATWCEPCLEELPDLIRFHEAHKGQDFTMVGVAMDAEGAAVVAPFVRQNKIPYPILISNGDLPEGYAIPGFPAAFMIDRQGKIARRYLGPKGYDELERDLAELRGH